MTLSGVFLFCAPSKRPVIELKQVAALLPKEYAYYIFIAGTICMSEGFQPWNAHEGNFKDAEAWGGEGQKEDAPESGEKITVSAETLSAALEIIGMSGEAASLDNQETRVRFVEANEKFLRDNPDFDQTAAYEPIEEVLRAIKSYN
jgi:hypothetical protein